MADAIAHAVGFQRKATLNGTVSLHDALSHNGTNWVVADADAASTYAQQFALAAGVSGDVIPVTNEMVLTDSDAPYTQDAPLYLSNTAGAHTGTRPTNDDDLIQVLGRAISTTEAHLKIDPPRELHQDMNMTGFLDTAAYLIQDAGPSIGVSLLAASDDLAWGCIIPDNAISLVKSELLWSANITLDASDTMAITAASGNVGTAHDLVSDATLTSVAFTVTADELAGTSLATGLDATNLIHPGRWLSIRVDKTAEGAGGDDPVMLGLHLVWKAA